MSEIVTSQYRERLKKKSLLGRRKSKYRGPEAGMNFSVFETLDKGGCGGTMVSDRQRARDKV